MEEKKIAKVSATTTESLIQDLRQIIEHARSHVASTVNYALSIMYWKIGGRINNEILDNRRAEYGKQIVASVARQLREEYGAKGFDEKIGVELWHYSHEDCSQTRRCIYNSRNYDGIIAPIIKNSYAKIKIKS